MYEKHLNAKQLADIEARRKAMSPDDLVSVQSDWAALKTEVRSAVRRRVDPTSAEGKALGARWKALVDEFTGGDADIGNGLKQMHRHEAALQKVTGNDDRIMDWVDKAIGR